MYSVKMAAVWNRKVKSRHAVHSVLDLTRMTRGAGPTFWSVFIQLDLRNIFENILVQKNLSNFLMMIFFFEIFWNFKIFEI